MNLAIPLYIEEHKVSDEPLPQFHLRPLFFPAPVKVSQQLSSGMTKLAQAIRHDLDSLAHQTLQQGLVPWTFSPALLEQTVKFSLQLRRQTADCRLLVVSFEAFDRRLAVIPALSGLYFEVLRGGETAVRAQEVITDHFRRLEKDEGDDFEIPESLNTCKRAWLTTLELDVHPNPALPRPPVEGLMAIFSQERADGRAELQKVGRCLDWLFPDELERVVGRDAQADELTRLLAARDRRPILLLGPRKVGKTALVHEAVYRRVTQRTALHQQSHVAERNVWLLSPARLISGMSYVGQWEGRLLAILQEAANRQHVLYFDDVLGLYQAGKSSDSDLNVAAVMRPWMERHDFRLLAEMTPDAFRVLREVDRGMADLFHVLPLREPEEGQSRRILMHVVRSLEDRHRCRFDVEAMPAAMDLVRRYVRDQAMPGKAAALLEQLAHKFRQGDVDRATVLSEFAARSGLSIAFLDQASRLSRNEIIESLAKEIIGQNAALRAMADVVAIAKARLNDPGRPLGTLLFLGPTGVGKTAAARALARYLYGGEARLLRFDMNEFIDPASLSRLTGTFSQPDGLLTAALRRQPYCVLLLDEIEKAHPSVFDLLLQVLGEGRLTDALGRTSDFTSAVVIMTSNLGTREAATSFGLRPASRSRQETFIDTAKAFFRPEFFNRIDRIVPFEALGREHVASIADRLIADLFRREGLIHRRCVLDVHPAAMARIVEQGYHPELGARALKRTIERQLTAPIAARLAALTPEAPMVISIYPSGQGIAPHVQTLNSTTLLKPRLLQSDFVETDALLERIEHFVNEVEARISARESGRSAARVSTDKMSATHFRYFAMREQIGRIDRLIQQIDQAARRPANVMRRAPRVKAPIRLRRIARADGGAAPLPAAQEIHARLADLFEHARPLSEEPAERMSELHDECALLAAMSSQASDRAILGLRPLGAAAPAIVADIAQAYARLFSQSLGFLATPLRLAPSAGLFLLLEMPGIAAIVRGEAGTHLLYPAQENILPMQVALVPLAEDEDAQNAAHAFAAARDAWRVQVAAGEASVESDPHPLGPVIRVYDPRIATLDLRTALICQNLANSDDLRRFILAGLPLPEQFASQT